MELTELRCFVTLAEQLHYGRAAARMYISQSALSKRIAGLERELGVVLFERTRHEVALTEAGRRLLPDAQRVVDVATGFSESARRLTSGEAGGLRMGYSGAVSVGALTDVLEHFRECSPGVEISLRESASHATLLNDVADRLLDAAFVRYIRADPRLSIVELRREPTVVAVYATHPYFSRQSLDFAELRDQPLVMLGREVDADVHAHATLLFERAGFAPPRVHEAQSVQTSLTMVASGLGLAVVTASAALVVPAGVRCVPLTAPSWVSVWLAYRAGDTSPVLARLVSGLPPADTEGKAAFDSALVSKAVPPVV